jgi:hypothetical protein
MGFTQVNTTSVTALFQARVVLRAISTRRCHVISLAKFRLCARQWRIEVVRHGEAIGTGAFSSISELDNLGLLQESATNQGHFQTRHRSPLLAAHRRVQDRIRGTCVFLSEDSCILLVCLSS